MGSDLHRSTSLVAVPFSQTVTAVLFVRPSLLPFTVVVFSVSLPLLDDSTATFLPVAVLSFSVGFIFLLSFTVWGSRAFRLFTDSFHVSSLVLRTQTFQRVTGTFSWDKTWGPLFLVCGLLWRLTYQLSVGGDQPGGGFNQRGLGPCKGVLFFGVLFRFQRKRFIRVRGTYHGRHIHLTMDGDIMGVLFYTHATQYSGKGTRAFKGHTIRFVIMTFLLPITVRKNRRGFAHTTFMDLLYPFGDVCPH